MKKFNTLLFVFLGLCLTQLQAQTRYLDFVFDEVNVETDVTYGQNISALLMAVQELKMDVYTPVGDDATDRPVVIYLHTGSFLPQYLNGQITGVKHDSTAIEVCTRLARMGYVAVSATYRLGWLPEADDQNVRTSTLLQAAYRGIIDTRTCIRFLRKSVDEGNPYDIDPNKFVAWGQGTGGYLSYGAAFLDRYEQIVIDKFINTETLQPFVDTLVHGNIDGTNQTMQNLPNHVGYNSDIQMAVNMGGALGDISWIEGETSTRPEPPAVGFHVPTDFFAPFGDGPVIVPTTNEFVVNVSGTRTAIAKVNEVGTNDPLDPVLDAPLPLNARVEAYKPFPFQFPGQAATTLATDHMYPFITPGFRVESGPWDWWSKEALDAEIAAINQALGTDYNADSLHADGLLTNPDMSAEKARRYIDTVMMYYAPRACATFGFEECLSAVGVVDVDEILDDSEVGLTLAPNPASEQVFFQTNAEYPIKDVRLFNMQGLLIRSHLGVDNNSFTLQRSNLPPGTYVALLHFEEGMVSKKIVFK